MPILQFAPAVRKGAHVIVTLYGESGSGKTYSALLLARGLAGPSGKVCMIDTETGRGLVYASLPHGYDYAELTPPFSPERYVEALSDAEGYGADVIVIDSVSHEWEGIGGILESADASGAKGLVKWARPKQRHKRFVQALLNTRCHLVLCARAKEKLLQRRGADGKEEIVSGGFVSIQDRRFIYETTVQLFMPNEEPRGVPRIEKCPEDLLAAFPAGERVSVRTGERLRAWVESGAPVDHEEQTLRRAAEAAAGGGTAALQAWWAGLSVADKRRLLPVKDNLKSIAAAADLAMAEPAEEDEEGVDELDDPFSSRPPDRRLEEARSAALAGPDSLEAWWSGRSDEERATLAAHWPELDRAARMAAQ